MTTIFYNHKIWNEQLGSGAPNQRLLFVSFWNSHEFHVSSTLFPTSFPSFFRCQALLASLLCCPSAARLLPGPPAPRDARRRQRHRRRPARCTGGPCSWRCRKWKARWRRPIYHKRNLDWNDWMWFKFGSWWEDFNRILMGFQWDSNGIQHGVTCEDKD